MWNQVALYKATKCVSITCVFESLHIQQPRCRDTSKGRYSLTPTQQPVASQWSTTLTVPVLTYSVPMIWSCLINETSISLSYTEISEQNCSIRTCWEAVIFDFCLVKPLLCRHLLIVDMSTHIRNMLDSSVWISCKQISGLVNTKCKIIKVAGGVSL